MTKRPKPQMATSRPVERKLFHNREGQVDFQRMLEQLIPSVLIGAVVVYANNLVTQSQVADLRADVAIIKSELRGTNSTMSTQNNDIVRLQSSMTAYLGQQTTLNAAMDARLTYLERAERRR
jgi:hypothetical protein